VKKGNSTISHVSQMARAAEEVATWENWNVLVQKFPEFTPVHFEEGELSHWRSHRQCIAYELVWGGT
jgi:nicotinamide mononucleotide adenylyltransferase